RTIAGPGRYDLLRRAPQASLKPVRSPRTPWPTTTPASSPTFRSERTTSSVRSDSTIACSPRSEPVACSNIRVPSRTASSIRSSGSRRRSTGAPPRRGTARTSPSSRRARPTSTRSGPQRSPPARARTALRGRAPTMAPPITVASCAIPTGTRSKRRTSTCRTTPTDVRGGSRPHAHEVAAGRRITPTDDPVDRRDLLGRELRAVARHHAHEREQHVLAVAELLFFADATAPRHDRDGGQNRRRREEEPQQSERQRALDAVPEQTEERSIFVRVALGIDRIDRAFRTEDHFAADLVRERAHGLAELVVREDLGDDGAVVLAHLVQRGPELFAHALGQAGDRGLGD